MTAIANTHRLVERWKAAGLTDDQAGKMVDALSSELDEGVATKNDITAIRSDIAIAVRDLKIWTGSVGAVLFAALAAIRYFG